MSGVLGSRARAIIVLLECIWNVPAVSLVPQPLTIPSPWVLLRVRWFITLVPKWVTVSRFLAGNRDVELTLITFSSLLIFRVFLSFLLP